MIFFLFHLILFAMNPTADTDRTVPISIEEFSTPAHLDWRIVNDGVMGGLSESQMQRTEAGMGIFAGTVSLENNGGFASTRALIREMMPSFSNVKIRVKGDGKRYQLRFRADGNFDGASYRHAFDTQKEEWQEITFALADFEPVFRGRVLANYPLLQSTAIRQVGFLIADKQEGDFRLEIDWIRAVD